DTGHFLSCCFCCSCCCINGKLMTHGPNANFSMFSRIEGVSIKVDESLCNGCGKCVAVCVFRGRELVDGKAKIDQDRCLGSMFGLRQVRRSLSYRCDHDPN
ncbi:MAG: 4Fe-4S binding protein, partial [Promethearchaeota archaeon]